MNFFDQLKEVLVGVKKMVYNFVSPKWVTPEQRLKVYESILCNLKKGDDCSLCLSLMDAIDKDRMYWLDAVIYFPEFGMCYQPAFPVIDPSGHITDQHEQYLMFSHMLTMHKYPEPRKIYNDPPIEWRVAVMKDCIKQCKKQIK